MSGTLQSSSHNQIGDLCWPSDISLQFFKQNVFALTYGQLCVFYSPSQKACDVMLRTPSFTQGGACNKVIHLRPSQYTQHNLHIHVYAHLQWFNCSLDCLLPTYLSDSLSVVLHKYRSMQTGLILSYTGAVYLNIGAPLGPGVLYRTYGHLR